tara:strand:- start:47 stop:1066 length:1020 start_codon:yes stop_codon:yes gene_type:complete
MDKLFDSIQKHRDLSPSTIKSYRNSLIKLSTECEFKGAELINQWVKVLDHIVSAEQKLPYKLNILKCYIVAMDSYIKDEIEEFGALSVGIQLDMGLFECRKIQTKFKEKLDINKFSEMKTEKEVKNWVGFEDLEKCVPQNFKLIKDILKRTTPDHKDIHKILLWVISAIYSAGKDNPPLRLDFNDMKIISKDNYDEQNDPNQNYLVVLNQRKKYFVLNQYKTFKKYGQKTIPVGSKLNTVINKYMKIKTQLNIPTDLLLFNNKYEALSEALLSGYVGEAFHQTGKKINANLIRHIFITEIALNLPLGERNEIAKKMCHDLTQQLIYNKIHNPSDDEYDK